MLEPIYSLTLSRTDDGHFVKSAPASTFSSMEGVSLGSAYSDAFRKNRAPVRAN